MGSGYTRATKQNLIRIYEEVGTEVFGNSRIVEILDCSETTATKYINRMYEELQITVMVEGAGKGKYRFIKMESKAEKINLSVVCVEAISSNPG